MESLSERNPITVLICLLAALLPPMFGGNPVLSLISLAGGFSFHLMLRRGRVRLWYLIFFFGSAILTPLTYHNGRTVLFVLWDAPITWEALLYGMSFGVMILSALYWFDCLSALLTEDRLFYLLGGLSPKLALLLSMILRFIPLFAEKSREIDKSAHARGLYREDNALENIRGKSQVFSILLTWGLENGIVTADSMAARGYGVGRRTFFARYRFRWADALLCILTLIALVPVAAAILLGRTECTFYPDFVLPKADLLLLIAAVCYGILALIPTFLEITEEIKWKSLRQKI